MTNNSIEQVFHQFQDEFGIKPNGQVNSSIRGVARLASVDEKAIRHSLKEAEQKLTQLAKFLLSQEFQAAELTKWVEDGIPDVAVALILEYYAYECQPRYQKEQARLVCRAFRAIGFREWVKQQKGTDGNQQTTEQQLPPKRDSVDFINAADKLSKLPANGQLKQLLEDALVDDLSLNKTNSNALTASQKEYTIVKVRAKELGYTIEQINAGTGLGRYVANRIDFAFKKRVGDYQVKHYAVTDELDNTIHDYFT